MDSYVWEKKSAMTTESPQHEKQHTNEENQPLLPQYHQFVEDKAVARNNQLGE
jgi:hypothetical protein